MKKFFYSALFAVAAITVHAQPCSDLFISEYVEGSSFNKAIEVYNPTPGAISLTGYKIQMYINGASAASSTFNFSGTLAAGGVYVIANSQASTAIKATADTLFNGVTNFNGDDAIALLSNTTVIDVIGEIGVDPGMEWPVDTGTTAEHTLVRKISVQAGSTVWTTGQNEWDVFKRDTFLLGAHTMTPCAPPVDTVVRMLPLSASVSETATSYNINIALNQVPSSDKTLDLVLKSGDAADVGNFTTVQVIIPANSSSNTVAVMITNDTIKEGNEQFEFLLTNPSSGLTVDADSIFTLTITDDDSIAPPAPLYPIATVTTIDVNGVVDSNGVRCRVSGVVYGVNLRGVGLQFTIHDGTGGIGVFSSVKTFGYTVQEGDSVVAGGIIGQFSGFAQIGSQVGTLDTVYQVGTGTLPQPTVVSQLDESTESELVRMNQVWLADVSQWDTAGNANGFTVDFTNGQDTFEMRIDEQVDLFTQSAPPGHFDVIGLGGQFDGNSPFNLGYDIWPRSSADLILHTGINEGVQSNFVIYPNPTQGIFTIKLAEQSPNEVTIRMIDVTGRAVFAEKKNAGETNIRMNVSSFTKGLYIIEITSGASVQRQKVSIR